MDEEPDGWWELRSFLTTAVVVGACWVAVCVLVAVAGFVYLWISGDPWMAVD